MILPQTLPDLDAVEDGSAAEARPVEADAAAARTRADYGRVSRWALGLLGTAGAVAGILPLGFAVDVVATGHDPLGDGVFVVVVVGLAAILLVPSIRLLVALHRSGRRLARAAGFWAGLPYRQGRRAPTRGDWFAARFAGFSSDLLLRLITSAFAALAAIFAASMVYYGAVVQPSAATVAIAVASTALFAAVCIGQFGGVQRIQRGYTARDPRTFARRGSGDGTPG